MSSSTVDSIAVLRPTAEVLLDLWLDESSMSDRLPIGLKGEPSYRYFWSTWLQYLRSGRNGAEPLAIEWYDVTGAIVAGFLQSGPAGRKPGTGVSDITRRRYWRLLDRIYDFAVRKHWIASNPAKALEERERPPIENSLGAIATPQVWAALQSILEVASDTAGPVESRNRALLLCVTEMALMPSELRTLTLDSVFYSTDGGRRRPYQLQLDGPGRNQRRRIVMPEAAVKAVEAWLAVRHEVCSDPSVQTLFCTKASTARKPSSKPAGEMTSVTLLLLVRELLLAAAEKAGQPPPARLGPQILRNTRLVMWLNDGVPANQVAVWAGLKNVKGLYHLREHLNPEIRISVKSVRDDQQ